MRALGILRGFPGLGRVVSGTAILETLRDDYSWDIKIISYLQGNSFLKNRGYPISPDVTEMDYCSIGLLPTHRMGVYIHEQIKTYQPDIIIVDGEPLILHSLRISYPHLKIVALLNPSDVDNPQNDREAMEFFNSMYQQANIAIVHGLRSVYEIEGYPKLISVGTILRKELFSICNQPSNHIYCILGGGTVNVGAQFVESTIQIARLSMAAAEYLPDYQFHIICSSDNIYDKMAAAIPKNVLLHREILDAITYYSDAALVVTRSGRNTLSELAYLGIPGISFVSGCRYRRAEQEQNIQSLNASNICMSDTHICLTDFVTLCKTQIQKGKQISEFQIGNDTAIQQILSL
ncbi:MAG: glycosyltransferase [Parabacteroides sp.]